MATAMRVHEIFTSIQGEGPDIGRRVVFVRLHGCNKSCEWCDTKYANEIYTEIEPEEVANTIIRTGIDHVVFTGGEPTLQIDEVIEVIEYLSECNPLIHIAIESNGSIDFDIDMFDLAVISPKNLDDAEKWVGRDVVLKFVCSDDNVDEIMSWCVARRIRSPYFMPLGVMFEHILQHSYLIIQKMEEYRINGYITPRLHAILRVK